MGTLPTQQVGLDYTLYYSILKPEQFYKNQLLVWWVLRWLSETSYWLEQQSGFLRAEDYAALFYYTGQNSCETASDYHVMTFVKDFEKERNFSKFGRPIFYYFFSLFIFGTIISIKEVRQYRVFLSAKICYFLLHSRGFCMWLGYVGSWWNWLDYKACVTSGKASWANTYCPKMFMWLGGCSSFFYSYMRFSKDVFSTFLDWRNQNVDSDMPVFSFSLKNLCLQ